jgi:lysyl-tRNA synthetase class 2
MEFDELAQGRIAKLNRLRQEGINPYPLRSKRTHEIAQARAVFEGGQSDGVVVTIVGRLTALRGMGKASFGDLRDGTGRAQIYFKRDALGDGKYALLDCVDLGDFLQATGPLFRTRTGEITVEVQDFAILTKSLSPLPEKWHGLRDIEVRVRQRYLDLLANPEVSRHFIIRSKAVTSMRRFLDGRGFLEVETPILQPLYGGAAARPFVTHHNALNRDLYLRIATELYLKRLVVGGFEKVYEIGKNFRNEGIDSEHNPEFTAMESYEAYADYFDVMRMVEEMVAFMASETLGAVTIAWDDHEISLTPPWRRVTMRQAILEHAGIDILAAVTLQDLRSEIAGQGIKLDFKPTWAKTVDELFSEMVQPNFIQPTFCMEYPLELSPFAKQTPGDPRLVERFEGFIGGLEVANAFTELNDPLDQLERFQEQVRQRAAGDDETQPFDEDFIAALMHGMPPTGGLGMGVDRLAMLLSGQRSIREVILFPQLRSVG